MSNLATVANRAEADRLYHATAMISDRAALLEDFIARSRAFREKSCGILNISYGAHKDEVADIFFPKGGCEGAPVHIFLHGGFWYQFGKEEWSFVAEGLTQEGVIVVVPKYSLCPEVSVPQILQQMRMLLAWCHNCIGRYGGAVDNITVSGHSAGGHLATELLLTWWQRDYGLPDDLIKGATSISGLYNLLPLRESYVQEFICLSSEDASRVSPALKVRPLSTPVAAIITEGDPDGFHAQHEDFIVRWKNTGNVVDSIELKDVNHLTCLFAMQEGVILDTILRQSRERE